MSIDTAFLKRCLYRLEGAWSRLRQSEPNSDDYDIFLLACVKAFELILEQSGKLIRMRLREHFADSDQVNQLTFKGLFRHAAKHGLMDDEAAARWFEYRDSRNDTAHEYGEEFAKATLKILPTFITDTQSLIKVIDETNHD